MKTKTCVASLGPSLKLGEPPQAGRQADRLLNRDAPAKELIAKFV